MPNGRKNLKAAKEIPTGGFAVMNMGTHHYAFTKKEAIIQLTQI